MKAVRINQWAQPVSIEELSEPSAGADDVLVRVRASSINPIDGAIASGHMAQMYTAPMTLGTDFAGEVVSVGENVTHVQPGDAVYGMSLARGAWAEYAAVNGSGVARRPTSLDEVHAAAVPLAGLTAWQTLFNLAKLQSGERVLIHGAAGGIGTYAVQLAKSKGAHVIANDMPGKASFLRELGADEVVEGTDRFEEVVGKVDVVLDLVGGEFTERSYNVLQQGGRYVSPTAQPSQEEAAARGIEAHSTFTQPTVEELTSLAEQIDAGKVRVFVSRSFPLEQAQTAMEYKQDGNTNGKVGLSVA